MTGNIRAWVARLVRWAVIEADGADQGPTPWQQIRYLDHAGRSTPLYPYGFSAVAPAGSPAIVFQVSGQADSRVHLPGSPSERPPLKPGEVAVYHPETGSAAIFRKDGSLEIVAVGSLSALVTGDASLEAGGTVSVAAGGTVDVTAAGAVAITSAATVTLTAPTVVVAGHIDQDGANVGFRGSAPIPKPVINGTKTGGTAQNQLLIALDAMGLIDDQT